ncbi:hypothetical protein, partial [Bradyrhizobium sp.]|uniref:hypothetical protein n=1 Tax=Bradyrhizobium sp. TaxID=376 RepID=UPI0025BFB4D7
QHDGFHLTQYAQGLVGEAVGRAIVDDIRAKDGPCASTARASAGNVDDVSRTDTLVGRFI